MADQRFGARVARSRRAGAIVTVALLISVAARPAPIASGPRPPVEHPSAVADRTLPAPAHVDERFATLPFSDELGRPGTWVLADVAKPLAMTLERDVADRFGLDAVGRALEQWNDTPGSDFAVALTGIVDTTVDRKVRDGVNRVFIDRRECGERFLARAHLHTAEVEVRGGRPIAWVTEVDIGVCERLSPELLDAVMRHELAHVAGLGHLCEPSEDCWTEAMGSGHRCRVMATAAYACQTRQPADEEAFAYLHPLLPRVAGDGPASTVAAISRITSSRAGVTPRVLVTAADAPVPLRAAAVVLAGIEGTPHLIADDDCTDGAAGDELNRLAAIDATVVLVGDLAGSCEDDLRIGWELEVERLPDVTAVNAAIAELSEAGPTRAVVAPAPTPGAAGVPDAVLAIPAAVGLGAPLVVADDGDLRGVVRGILRDFPSVTGIVLVGSGQAVAPGRVTRLEAEAGARVRPLVASDGLELALKIARMRDVFPPSGLDPVLVAADRADDALAAAHLAAATRAPLVPVFTGPASPDVRVAGFLDDRAEGGYVVGASSAIDSGLQVRLSRAVDGAS